MQNTDVLSRPTDGPLGNPDPDPENPVTAPHDSHRWEGDGAAAYFLECAACGCRDHWPGARKPCETSYVGQKRGTRPHTLAEALRKLYLDLDAFAVWWLAREATLGLVRPSLEEWRAEFFEFAKGKRLGPEREAM